MIHLSTKYFKNFHTLQLFQTNNQPKKIICHFQTKIKKSKFAQKQQQYRVAPPKKNFN